MSDNPTCGLWLLGRTVYDCVCACLGFRVQSSGTLLFNKVQGLRSWKQGHHGFKALGYNFEALWCRV